MPNSQLIIKMKSIVCKFLWNRCRVKLNNEMEKISNPWDRIPRYVTKVTFSVYSEANMGWGLAK
jgi:hypothetical protein